MQGLNEEIIEGLVEKINEILQCDFICLLTRWHRILSHIPWSSFIKSSADRNDFRHVRVLHLR